MKYLIAVSTVPPDTQPATAIKQRVLVTELLEQHPTIQNIFRTRAAKDTTQNFTR